MKMASQYFDCDKLSELFNIPCFIFSLVSIVYLSNYFNILTIIVSKKIFVIYTNIFLQSIKIKVF